MSNWIKKGKIFDKEWSQLPIVDVYPNFYKIYYSTRDNQNRSIPKYIKISKDFLLIYEYGQILNLGKPGSFDSHGVMPTDIITLEDGTKYLYYVGWSKRIDVPYWNSLGLAISKDNGVTWEKYSEGPILSSCVDEPGFVGTCCVIPPTPKEAWDAIFNQPTWEMIYSSAHWEEINGKQECIYDLKLANSTNGINWKATGDVVLPLLSNEGGIAAPRIIKNGDYEYEMYFSVRSNQDYRTNPKKSYKIKKAYSNDLINWTRENNQSEFLVPKGEELMNAYPYLVVEEDKDILFYNSDFGNKGLSYAIRNKK